MKKVQQVKTQYGAYRCVFEPERDMGGYAVEARGVVGALSWGKTLREAKLKIIEAIEGAIETKAIVAAERRGLIG